MVDQSWAFQPNVCHYYLMLNMGISFPTGNLSSLLRFGTSLSLYNKLNLSFRTSVAHIPRLSCTDIAQKWGRTQAANVCPPVPVEDLCHVGRPAHGEKPASGGGYLDTLLAAAPTSALAVHRRRAALQSGNQLATQGGTAVATVPTVVSAAVRSVVQQAGNLSGGQHCPNVLEQGFFEKHVQKSESECAEICAATVGQNGAGWDQERRLRITASSSYQWYTYNGSDWKGKVERFYKNRDAFKGNAATRHGHAFEAEAIKMYEEFSGLGVCKVGLVIPTNVPWLGCSPDGIVFDGLVPAKLVEVKCPAKLAADVGIWEAMSGKVLSFIECDGENVRLKPRHPYYGQVQLSMAILGVRHCDFVVYGSARDEMFIVNVPRDDRFVESMLLKLESVYFSHILPFLVRTSKMRRKYGTLMNTNGSRALKTHRAKPRRYKCIHAAEIPITSTEASVPHTRITSLPGDSSSLTGHARLKASERGTYRLPEWELTGS